MPPRQHACRKIAVAPVLDGLHHIYRDLSRCYMTSFCALRWGNIRFNVRSRRLEMDNPAHPIGIDLAFVRTTAPTVSGRRLVRDEGLQVQILLSCLRALLSERPRARGLQELALEPTRGPDRSEP
jgi:hypothetical protein